MSKKDGLTKEELDNLKAFILESQKLAAEEPEWAYKSMTEEEYKAVSDFYLLGKGERPAKADLFTPSETIDTITGKPTKTFYDTKMDAWNQKCNDLNEKYRGSILKVLKSHIEHEGDVLELINEVVAAALEQAKAFSTIRQGTATNALTKVRSIVGSNTQLDKMTGAATVKEGNLTLTFPNFEHISGLKTSTYKLLDAITVALTESGAKSPFVTLSLEEYMDKCGLKDRKEARKQAAADLETLFDARISYKERARRGQPVGFADARICEAKGISRNGIISFQFSDTFYQILLGCTIMPYPDQLWKLNSKRNPNSFYLLRKIAEHKNMNAGKKNADVISVKTLLAACPFIPKHTTVAKSDRHFSDRIIVPFERDMDELKETLTWEYCHSSNTPLTDDELLNFNYDLFSSLLVKITWVNYPDQTQRLERKAQKIEEAKKKKRAAKGGNAPHKGG